MTSKSKAPELDFRSIRDASTADILAFAEAKVGLTFESGASREFIIEQITAALAWERPDPSEGATHVRVLIPKSAEQGGTRPYRGGFNGNMFTIQREVEVEITIGQYNSIIDVNRNGFDIESLKDGVLTEGSPVDRRLQRTGVPIQVIQFINKGSVEAAPAAPASDEE